jgi:hypothetical protein
MISRKLVENLHELTEALERHDGPLLERYYYAADDAYGDLTPNSNPPDT